MVPTAHQQQLAAESLYRDANSLLYADNKPSDEAIDRVIGKINHEYVLWLCATLISSLITYSISLDKRRKFSRKRPNEDTGDITYINEKNRIFNKKVEPWLPLQQLAFTDTPSQDCALLRQIYRRNTCELRARNRIVKPIST
jgi:hypothetical protein